MLCLSLNACTDLLVYISSCLIEAPTNFPTLVPTDGKNIQKCVRLSCSVCTVPHIPAINSSIYKAPTLESRWNQIGNDIVGNTTSLQFGWSVAVASSQFIVIIGTPSDDADSGLAEVYKLDPCQNEWLPYGQNLRGKHSGAGFGTSTDISDNGDIIAVGAAGNNGRGQVLVFKYSDEEGRWVQRGQELNGDELNDLFGSAVSLSGDGNRLAVGSPTHDPQGVGTDAGLVRVFEYDEDETVWKQLGGDLVGKEPYEKYGFSLKMSNNGEAMIVGAPFYHKTTLPDGNATWGGRAAVYMYNSGRRVWGQAGKEILYTTPDERFGWSVDISTRGFSIAVGAPWSQRNGQASGELRSFELNSTSREWIPRGDSIHGEDLGRWFGNTACLSNNGNTLATALWCDMPWREECGYGGVRMFEYLRGQQTWKQVGRALPGRTRFDPYSISIAMAKDDAVLFTGVDLQTNQSVVRAFKPGQFDVVCV